MDTVGGNSEVGTSGELLFYLCGKETTFADFKKDADVFAVEAFDREVETDRASPLVEAGGEDISGASVYRAGSCTE